MLRKLEKYELLEEIGHGGMATVFRGRDERLDRLVAVKVLHPHLQKAPEARIRFTPRHVKQGRAIDDKVRTFSQQHRIKRRRVRHIQRNVCA